MEQKILGMTSSVSLPVARRLSRQLAPGLSRHTRSTMFFTAEPRGRARGSVLSDHDGDDRMNEKRRRLAGLALLSLSGAALTACNARVEGTLAMGDVEFSAPGVIGLDLTQVHHPDGTVLDGDLVLCSGAIIRDGK